MEPAPTSAASPIEALQRMYERHPFPSREAGHVEVARSVVDRLGAHGFVPAGKWLDLGCGTGELLATFAEVFPQVEFTGVDFSRPSLERARQHADRKGLRNVQCRHGDFRSPDWCDASWDVVSALGTLHYLSDLPKAYREVGASVRPGGWFVLYHYGTYGRLDRSLKSQLVATLVPDPEAIDTRIEVARKLFDLRNADGQPLESPWVADQYCNPCETTQTMVEAHDLLVGGGLEPVEWIGMSEDPAQHFGDPTLRARFEALPRRERLAALDLKYRRHDNLVLARRPG